MALLTTQNVTRSGITPSFGAVAASDTFVPDSDTWIEVKNAGGTQDNVTVTIPSALQNPIPGLTIATAAVAVPITTGDKMIGPFPAQFFADPTTGLATVTHSFTTSVTSGVFKLTRP